MLTWIYTMYFLAPNRVLMSGFGLYKNGHKKHDSFALWLLSLHLALHRCTTTTHRVFTQTHKLLKWGNPYQYFVGCSTCNTPVSAPSMTIPTAEVIPPAHSSLSSPDSFTKQLQLFWEKKGGGRDNLTTQQILRNMVFHFSFNLF